MGAAVNVPIIGTTYAGNSNRYEQSSDVDTFKEIVRYLVYDVALCYLYAPNEKLVDGDNINADGTKMTTHRTRRMCAPMIPAAPSKMADFRTHYDLGDLNFASLEYTQACDAHHVKSLLGNSFLGQDDLIWASTEITSAPFGGVLRFAEGLDAIRNFGTSGLGNITNDERGKHIRTSNRMCSTLACKNHF